MKQNRKENRKSYVWTDRPNDRPTDLPKTKLRIKSRFIHLCDPSRTTYSSPPHGAVSSHTRDRGRKRETKTKETKRDTGGDVVVLTQLDKTKFPSQAIFFINVSDLFILEDYSQHRVTGVAYMAVNDCHKHVSVRTQNGPEQFQNKI